jgi:lipoprotein-releasing system permease protein
MDVLIFIAVRQLTARKLLNGIATGAVVVAMVVLISVKGIIAGFQEKFYSSILRISPHLTIFDRELRTAPPILARYSDTLVATAVSHENPSDRQLRIKRPNDIVRTLEQMDGVVAASVSLAGSAVLALGAKEYPVDVRGIEPAKQRTVTPIADFVVGGSYDALGSAPDGVLLGLGVANRLGAKVGDVILAATPKGQPMTLKVVGVFESEVPSVDNGRAYVTLHNAQVLLGRPDAVGRIEARLANVDRAVEIAQRAEDLFGYDTESWQETNKNFTGLFAMQTAISEFVTGALLAVGGFAILAVQVMIVLQKTKDIAILRSVGFRRRDILTIFLFQGAAVATVGGLTGCLIGHFVSVALSRLKIHSEGIVKSDTFLVHEEPRIYVYGFAFALLIGLVATLLPAIRGSKVEPVDVLRGQVG